MLRMGNITNDGYIDDTELKYVDLPKKEIEKYTVRCGDILFNRTNSTDLVGKTAVFTSDKPFAYAGYLVRSRVNTKATPEYISAFLNSKAGKRVLRGMAKSIVGMANINAKEMQSIPIQIPPLELQQEFSRRLATLEKKRLMFQPSVLQMDRLFSSLQHRAFSGQL